MTDGAGDAEEVLSYLARLEEWPACPECRSGEVLAVVHPSDFDDALRVLEAAESGRLRGVVADDDLTGDGRRPPQWECRDCEHRSDSPLPRYQR